MESTTLKVILLSYGDAVCDGGVHDADDVNVGVMLMMVMVPMMVVWYEHNDTSVVSALSVFVLSWSQTEQ